MVSARRPLVWTLAAPFTVLTLGTGLQVGPDSGVTTMIEQALIEHQCSTTRAAAAPETDEYRECLSAQLLSLRADFGRNLSRLSGSERTAIDARCTRIRETQGPDAYLGCLGDRLASLRSRHHRTNPDSSASATTPPSAPMSAPSTTSSAPPPTRSTPPSSSSWWIGTALATLLVAAGGALVAMKIRRPSRTCRVCGTEVPYSGGLCQKCRHEAADAFRRLATERADQQRAQEEKQRGQTEHEEEQRQERALQEEEARPRQEQTRVREEDEKARHDGELRQPKEEARQPRQTAASAQPVFDPHAILGVPRGASEEEIRVAYQEAKAKYDTDQVSHLGVDIREHYKAKAQAVEQAYRQLTV